MARSARKKPPARVISSSRRTASRAESAWKTPRAAPTTEAETDDCASICRIAMALLSRASIRLSISVSIDVSIDGEGVCAWWGKWVSEWWLWLLCCGCWSLTTLSAPWLLGWMGVTPSLSTEFIKNLLKCGWASRLVRGDFRLAYQEAGCRAGHLQLLGKTRPFDSHRPVWIAHIAHRRRMH